MLELETRNPERPRPRGLCIPSSSSAGGNGPSRRHRSPLRSARGNGGRRRHGLRSFDPRGAPDGKEPFLLLDSIFKRLYTCSI